MTADEYLQQKQVQTTYRVNKSNKNQIVVNVRMRLKRQ